MAPMRALKRMVTTREPHVRSGKLAFAAIFTTGGPGHGRSAANPSLQLRRPWLDRSDELASAADLPGSRKESAIRRKRSQRHSAETPLQRGSWSHGAPIRLASELSVNAHMKFALPFAAGMAVLFFPSDPCSRVPRQGTPAVAGSIASTGSRCASARRSTRRCLAISR